jgi:predicted permease
MTMRGAAIALYRLCARMLLPGEFRREYGDELEQAVASRLGAARSVPGLTTVLVVEVADLLRTGLRERLGALGFSRGGSMLDGAADLRTGARNLVRRPGLALGATLIIALGIGATTTIYSVVDGVVLRPLPYDDPSSLVAVGGVAPGSASVDPETGLQDLAPTSSVEISAMRERAGALESLGAMLGYRILQSGENGVEVYVPAARVSSEVFAMLGVAPALGRVFLPGEFEFTGTGMVGSDVVVISHGFWQRSYGGDPNVLGRTLEVANSPTGVPPTIVGILPEDFRPPETFFPEGQLPEVYAPLALPRNDDPNRRIVAIGLFGLGRLRPGATLEQARAEAAAISAELSTESPNRMGLPGGRAREIGVNDLHAETVGTAGRTLWAFLAAAALLLLLTAMNAASLLLARALDRRQEIGVRVALGAGRLRVVRLLLVEAGILAAVGGATGILLAYGGVASFLRFAPPTIPRLATVTVDGRVLSVALLATVATGIAAGLVPAFGFFRRGPWEGLQAGGRTVSEPGSRVRTALVGGQLALAMVLLCGAGLLFSSFVRIRTADPGFEPAGLVVMSPNAEAVRISISDAPAFYRRWDPVLEAQASVPGVRSVAGASGLPFQAPTWAPRILLPGDGPDVTREGIAGYAITSDYLETMGIELVSGRTFGPEDGPDAEDVAIVNEAFVRTQLGGGDPLGLVITRDPEGPGAGTTPVAMRIVGVVEDVVQTRVEDGPRPAIYLPYTQAGVAQLIQWWSAVRTDRWADDVIPELRASLAGSEMRPRDVGTMEDRIALTQVTPRFQTLLVGAFALVALLLAAAGLHGSLAHTVRRRQRELGVRIALGADRSSVLRMVMRQGVKLSVVGLALGLAGTLALTRVLATFLFDMQPWDPPTLLAVATILLLVCAAACFVPARRATTVDPVRVLQAE